VSATLVHFGAAQACAFFLPGSSNPRKMAASFRVHSLCFGKSEENKTQMLHSAIMHKPFRGLVQHAYRGAIFGPKNSLDDRKIQFVHNDRQLVQNRHILPCPSPENGPEQGKTSGAYAA